MQFVLLVTIITVVSSLSTSEKEILIGVVNGMRSHINATGYESITCCPAGDLGPLQWSSSLESFAAHTVATYCSSGSLPSPSNLCDSSVTGVAACTYRAAFLSSSNIPAAVAASVAPTFWIEGTTTQRRGRHCYNFTASTCTLCDSAVSLVANCGDFVALASANATVLGCASAVCSAGGSATVCYVANAAYVSTGQQPFVAAADCSRPAFGPARRACGGHGVCVDRVPFDRFFSCNCTGGYTGPNCDRLATLTPTPVVTRTATLAPASRASCSARGYSAQCGAGSVAAACVSPCSLFCTGAPVNASGVCVAAGGEGASCLNDGLLWCASLSRCVKACSSGCPGRPSFDSVTGLCGAAITNKTCPSGRNRCFNATGHLTGCTSTADCSPCAPAPYLPPSTTTSNVCVFANAAGSTCRGAGIACGQGIPQCINSCDNCGTATAAAVNTHENSCYVPSRATCGARNLTYCTVDSRGFANCLGGCSVCQTGSVAVDRVCRLANSTNCQRVGAYFCAATASCRSSCVGCVGAGIVANAIGLNNTCTAANSTVCASFGMFYCETSRQCVASCSASCPHRAGYDDDLHSCHSSTTCMAASRIWCSTRQRCAAHCADCTNLPVANISPNECVANKTSCIAVGKSLCTDGSSLQFCVVDCSTCFWNTEARSISAIGVCVAPYAAGCQSVSQYYCSAVSSCVSSCSTCSGAPLLIASVSQCFTYNGESCFASGKTFCSLSNSCVSSCSLCGNSTLAYTALDPISHSCVAPSGVSCAASSSQVYCSTAASCLASCTQCTGAVATATSVCVSASGTGCKNQGSFLYCPSTRTCVTRSSSCTGCPGYGIADFLGGECVNSGLACHSSSGQAYCPATTSCVSPSDCSTCSTHHVLNNATYTCVTATQATCEAQGTLFCSSASTCVRSCSLCSAQPILHVGSSTCLTSSLFSCGNVDGSLYCAPLSQCVSTCATQCSAANTTASSGLACVVPTACGSSGDFYCSVLQSCVASCQRCGSLTDAHSYMSTCVAAETPLATSNWVLWLAIGIIAAFVFAAGLCITILCYYTRSRVADSRDAATSVASGSNANLEAKDNQFFLTSIDADQCEGYEGEESKSNTIVVPSPVYLAVDSSPTRSPAASPSPPVETSAPLPLVASPFAESAATAATEIPWEEWVRQNTHVDHVEQAKPEPRKSRVLATPTPSESPLAQLVIPPLPAVATPPQSPQIPTTLARAPPVPVPSSPAARKAVTEEPPSKFDVSQTSFESAVDRTTLPWSRHLSTIAR